MRLSTRILLFSVVLLKILSGNMLADEAVSTTKSDQAQAAQKLVKQLGSDVWADRTLAAKKLLEGGHEISSALHAGVADADAEIRRQCRVLLVKRIKNDLVAGIAALKAGDFKAPIKSGELPAWERYQKEIGSDRDARKLFAAMLTDESALLFASRAGGEIASHAVNARAQQVISALYNRTSNERRAPTLGTIAALIFVASHPDVIDEEGFLTGRWISTILQQSAFSTTLTSKTPSAASRQLVSRWLQKESSDVGDPYRIRIAVTYQIKPAGLELALRMLADGKNINASSVTLAIEGVARLGGKNYAGLIAKFLDDKRGMGVRIIAKKRMQMQVQDTALAWLVYVTGQDIAKYNMPNAKRYFDMLKTSPNRVLSSSYFYFSSDSARQTALKKLAEWIKKNPLPKLPANAVVKPQAEQVAAKNANGKSDVEPSDDKAEVIPLADRARLQRLNRARKMLEENPGRLEAISLIGRLLMEETDRIFQTEGDTPVYRTLRSAAEDLISRLEPKQLKVYEQQFGKLARSDLNDALRTGGPSALKQVVKKYFFTHAGGEALYHVAMKHIDRRQFFQAALWLSRLQRSHPHSETYQPRLSVLLAFCWHEAGVPDRAAHVLADLREAGHTSVVLFDKTLNLPDRDQAATWLSASFVDHSSGVRPIGHALPTQPINEQPSERTRIKTDYDGPVVKALNIVNDLHQQFGVAAIPQLEPVIAGDVVVFRTLTELTCVSLSTNKTLWQSSVLSGLDSLLPPTAAAQTKASVSLARALRERLWDRSAANSLVCDGQRVFAVEDVSPPDGGHFPVMEMLPNGTPTLREGSGKTHNRMTAWDVRTGKVLWECGGPAHAGPSRDFDQTDKSESKTPPKSAGSKAFLRTLAGARFIGAPVPLGDQLCVVGQIEDQIELLLIDSQTGDLVSRATLHVLDEGITGGRMIGFPFGKISSVTINAAGSAPVLHNDAVFVYVGSNRYVAFDLATQRILWAYEETRHDQPKAINIRNINLAQQFASKQMTQPDRWTRATPTIVGDQVIVTPPVTDLLVCLDRKSGKVLWDVPREDGLFVAGVTEGFVVVVGRSGVRGIRLSDGKTPWSRGAIPLPEGILPAGRGLLIPASDTEGLTSAELHLPQANGTVAVLNLANRLWDSNKWHINGPTGNLKLAATTIVSQDISGITIFDRNDNRREKIAASLAANPNDISVLVSAVRLAIEDNEFEKAIDLAKRAINADGDQLAEESLTLALTSAVTKSTHNATQAARFIGLAIESGELLSNTKLRTRVQQAIATSHQTQGQFVESLESWFEVIANLPGKQKELKAPSFVWRVREDRWVQAELVDLFAKAPVADRAAMDERLRVFQAGTPHERFIKFFGFHAKANESRLKLAKTYITKKTWLAAEQLLIAVTKFGSPHEQLDATHQLAEMLSGQKLNRSARFYAKQLATRFATIKDEKGRTGAQLAALLLKKIPNPLGESSAWPTGQVQVEEFKVKAPARYSGTVYQLLPEYRDDDSQDGTVELDSRLTTWYARDSLGQEKWKITVPNAVSSSVRYLRYAVRYNQSRSARQGQLTVAWIGDQVCAVDGFTKASKPLWSQSCFVANPLDPLSNQYRAQIRPQAVPHLDAKKFPLLVTTHFVCLQQGRKLIAVDPLDGSTLWWRDDLPSGCDLFGDSDFVFVRKPDSTTATVLQGLDGRKLGSREVPAIADRLLSRGRRCVNATTVGETLNIEMKDLWSQNQIWKKTIPKNSHVHVINANEIAMLQPNGSLEIVNIVEGNVVTHANLTMPDSVKGFLVQRKMDRLVVVVNEPEKVNALRIVQQPTSGQRAVNGNVYVLENNGKRISKIRFQAQSIKLEQPRDLPLLILFRRYQDRKKLANGGFSSAKPKTKVALLDVRSGRIVHSFDREFGYDIDYQLSVQPDKKQLEISTRSNGLRAVFKSRD
jgi:outer membrane protein assembly factor BamB